MKKVSFLIATLCVGALFIGLNFKTARDALPRAKSATGGDFVLQTRDGEFGLADHRKKVILIYFGYTFCPDICPTNLAFMAQALNGLTAAELENVVPIFISVDPERDSKQQLHDYATYFHPNIIGMTGTETVIRNLAERYGAGYQKVTGESDGGYLIDHTSYTYLVDKKGRLAIRFPHATDPKKIIDGIRAYLKKPS